jgi:hypothetical protein
MPRRHPRPLLPLKESPQPPKAQVPQLSPQQRKELDQIRGRRERAQYLLQFLSQSKQPSQ